MSVQVVMTYAALTAVLLGAFWAAPNIGWIQWIIVAAVGFALYGPQMLIGLCGAEVVPKPAVSAAQGFLGWISYLGEHLFLRQHFADQRCPLNAIHTAAHRPQELDSMRIAGPAVRSGIC